MGFRNCLYSTWFEIIFMCSIARKVDMRKSCSFSKDISQPTQSTASYLFVQKEIETIGKVIFFDKTPKSNPTMNEPKLFSSNSSKTK